MNIFATVMTYFCAGACLLIWPACHIFELLKQSREMQKRLDFLEARETLHSKSLSRLVHLEALYRTKVSKETQNDLAKIDSQEGEF